MTVRDFTTKCNNNEMWVEVVDISNDATLIAGQITDFKKEVNPDEHSILYEYFTDIHNLLNREVKSFEYYYDVIMKDMYVLYC